jgi:two-component system sensor histidine kinase EvgS
MEDVFREQTALMRVEQGLLRAAIAERDFMLTPTETNARFYREAKSSVLLQLEECGRMVEDQSVHTVIRKEDLNTLSDLIHRKFRSLETSMYEQSPKVLPDPYREVGLLFTSLYDRQDKMIDLYGEAAEERSLHVQKIELLSEFTVLLLIGMAFFLLRGQLLRSIQLARDLQEETRKAVAADRTKSEFIANMSHEIRTPMNAILGFSELLRGEMRENRRALEYLSGISTSGRSLLDLINDILDISKIESGRIEIQLSPCDIRTLLQEVGTVFDQQIRNKGLHFVLDISPDIPKRVLLDGTRLRQILFNLLGNAVKFTHEGEIRVTVRSERPPNAAETERIDLYFLVQDTGIGIRKEDQKRIFEPFVQQSGQSTREYGGTGLGLAISHRLALLMGGELDLESVPGKGSTFSLKLPGTPADSEEREYDKKASGGEIHFAPARILLIEDDPQNRTIVKSFLKKEQLTFVEASNGKEGLNFLHKDKFDLVLLDLKMPVMGGREVLSELEKEGWNSAPIVVMSASAQLPEERELRKRVAGLLRKPFERVELFSILARFLPHEEIQLVETSDNLQDEGNKSLSDEVCEEIRNLEGKDFQCEGEEIEGILSLYESLMNSLSINTAMQLGNSIENLAERTHIKSLARFASELQAAAESFSMEKLRIILKEIPECMSCCEILGKKVKTKE